MTPLYRIHSGGTMARTEGNIVTYYEVGHEIELSHDEAKRLNDEQPPGQYRVVRAGGELAEQTPRPASSAPRTVETKVSLPGVQTEDELRGAGIEVSEAGAEPELGTPLAALPIEGENLLPAVEPAESTIQVDRYADPSDVAPDWPTYLAAVTAHEAAETLRGLTSADDVQAALDAENGKSGLRRPLVIRAGNAAIKRLRK